VKDITSRNFGLLIAYVLPGSVALWACSFLSPSLRQWLVTSSMQPGGVTVGGFLYLTLASVASGLTVSTIRWLVVDRIHQLTGIGRPEWDDSKLQEKLDAFDALIENHYRYYQFYANMLVSMMLLVLNYHLSLVTAPVMPEWFDEVMAMVATLFWAGSRDTLRRYYNRAYILLGCRNESEVYDDQRTRNGTSQCAAECKREHQPNSPGNRQAKDEQETDGIVSDCVCIQKKGPRLIVKVAELAVSIEPWARPNMLEHAKSDES